MAGVSKSIASKVLNDYEELSVRDETRERVRRVARDLGYRPHAGARALAGSATGALALLVPALENPIYVRIVRGAFERARERGYVLLVAEDFDEQQADETFVDLVQSGRADGLLIASARPAHRLIESFDRQHVPHVFVDRAVVGRVGNVTMDVAPAGELVVEHFAELGHRWVGHISGPSGNAPGHARAASFRAAAEVARLELAVVHAAAYSEEGGAAALHALLDRHPDVTAVYASSLGQAIGALHAARGRGLAVPTDLSVVSYDDLPLAAYLAPPLTAVTMPLSGLGAAAVDALLEQIAGAAPRDVVIPTTPHLVRRASTGRPRPDRAERPRPSRTAPRGTARTGSRGSGMRLSVPTLDRLPAEVAWPPYDPRDVTAGIVHLGIGAFHRAHQAVYTDDVLGRDGGAWGIVGVTQRSPEVRDRLAPQDGLYCLAERGPRQTRLRVIGSVRRVLVAQEEPAALVAALADPAVRLVTLTVTERGYRHDPATGGLLVGDPDVAADLADGGTRTVPGQLAAGLARRHAEDLPLSVVCCDNLPSNGRFLRRLVLEHCERRDDALAAWVAAHVAFPSTVVDRIVPATTAADRAEVDAALGVEDHGTVVAEPFREWVVEDRFAVERPQWERAGARLVDDVAPYEAVKLRMLNGAHSMLAYLGALAGYETTAAAMRDEPLVAALRALMAVDVAPTLTPPPGRDLAAYSSTVLERFANPAITHRTEQIAIDGSQKLPQRLLATAADRERAGATAEWVALAVAAWMRYCDGRADDGRPLAVEDPLAPALRAAAGAGRPDRVVDAFLALDAIVPPELAASGRFRAAVVSWLADLTAHGTLATLRAAAGLGGQRGVRRR